MGEELASSMYASGGGQMLNRTVVLLLAFIALAADGVAAQSSHRFKVDVPFEFVLNGRTLPAGEYVIERTNAARPDIVTLKKKDGDFVRMIITQRVEKDEPSPTSSLVFIRRNGTHYLFQVWNVADMNGNQIPVPFDKTKDQQRNNIALVTLKAKP
jgi:hypothetical protein